MASVGFTTGSLHRSGIPFDERIKLYHSLGADAIELSFLTPDHLFDYHLSEQSKKDIGRFTSVSIHAPCGKIRYDDNSKTMKIIEKLRSLCIMLPIKGVVLHPDIIDNFEILDKSGLPFLIENMDRGKSYGILPDQFRELKRKYDFGFVLDVEHAYERDSSMRLARELIDVMGNRLKHMHVSGCCKPEFHVPTYCAANKEAISKILRMGLNVPIILEGVLSEDFRGSIRRELEYVRNCSTAKKSKSGT